MQILKLTLSQMTLKTKNILMGIKAQLGIIHVPGIILVISFQLYQLNSGDLGEDWEYESSKEDFNGITHRPGMLYFLSIVFLIYQIIIFLKHLLAII